MAAPLEAQSTLAGDAISITRTAGAITIDGDLSDEGWRGATRVEKWYEINPGDNTEPSIKSVGYLTYDSRFFYVAFDFQDPDPASIRAPLGDHDAVNGDSHDMAGMFIDALNTRPDRDPVLRQREQRPIRRGDRRCVGRERGAGLLLGFGDAQDAGAGGRSKCASRSPRCATRRPIRRRGASSLYRNYPRGFRYQFASARLPRGGNCTVCRENTLIGLEGLPGGGHLVAAPYVSASGDAHPRDGVLGAPLVGDRVKPHVGLDLKFTPNADTALDLAIKPDFSQVESDTAQISANERFALFFPEKRPFFLEGVDLFQTPLQAVYTRTITSPRWGGRVTGKQRGVRYTVLVAEDEGGGSAILPGPNNSSFADQEFGSTVFIARAKRDFGLSFLSVLATSRENHDGEGHSRLVGPDFQWRPSGADVVTGQLLFSESRTPNRTDLADEWDGRSLSGGAFNVHWNHSTTHFDSFAMYKDIADGFRADAGFIPQVGYREGFGFAGWTVRPKGFLSRQRTFVNLDYIADREGALITRLVELGTGMDTRLNGFMQFRYIDDRTRAGDIPISRRQFGYLVRFSPTRRRVVGGRGRGRWARRSISANARPARGATVNLSATINPSDHLEVALIANQRLLNVDTSVRNGRLLMQRVSRVRGTYTFTSRLFARIIAQYVSTTRDPSLSTSEIAPRDASFGGSALLAYKINWQSVMFVGYGDNRELSDRDRLEKLDRQFFVKLSYAFQR